MMSIKEIKHFEQYILMSTISDVKTRLGYFIFIHNDKHVHPYFSKPNKQ